MKVYTQIMDDDDNLITEETKNIYSFKELNSELQKEILLKDGKEYCDYCYRLYDEEFNKIKEKFKEECHAIGFSCMMDHSGISFYVIDLPVCIEFVINQNPFLLTHKDYILKNLNDFISPGEFGIIEIYQDKFKINSLEDKISKELFKEFYGLHKKLEQYHDSKIALVENELEENLQNYDKANAYFEKWNMYFDPKTGKAFIPDKNLKECLESEENRNSMR